MREPDERKADILDAVRNRDGLVIATGTVAEAADMSRPTARKYLEQLEEEGEVVEEELAGRMYVWYTPEVLEYGLGAFTGEDPPDPPDDEHEEESELRATGGPPVEQEHSPELMSTVEDLEEGMNQLRRDVAELDAAADDDPGEPYTDVRSPTRRAVLVERDYARQAATQLGVVTAAALALALVAASLPAVTVPGVDVPLSVGVVVVAGILAIGFGAATVAWGVLSILLRLGAFAWGDRTLPFRPDPDAEESDT